jgi:predicted chitinase
LSGFNPDNLIFEGYSKSQYLKSGQLPEGVVQVWFEAWDSYRNFNISGASKALIWLFQNEAPSLNLPEDKKQISFADPQNIVFNWAAGQSPYSVAGLTNQYKFEIWEIWPDDLNAEEVALSSTPAYTTTLSSTTLVYGTDCPILQTGRRYAWRVTAFDPDGKKQYKNNGRSTVRSFRFGRDCSVPDFKLDKVTTSKATLSWDNDSRYTAYTLRYRNKGKSDANWYEQAGSTTGSSLSGLSPATQYEVQLQGTCYEQAGGYSSSLTVQTAQELSYNCGSTVTDTSTSGKDLLPTLLHNDYFKAYDFDIQVESATGASGIFSGSGYARVPLLSFVKFKVSFTNITLNSSYKMVKGSVTLDYDESNGLVADITNALRSLGLTSGGGQTTFSDILTTAATTDTTLTVVSADTSTMILAPTVAGSSPITLTTNTGLVAISNSTEGSTQYVADTNTGTLYSGSTTGTGSTQPTVSNKPLSYTVAFGAHKNQDYGFDLPGNGHPEGNYGTANIGGSSVQLPWKSVAGNSADRLVLGIKGPAADTAVHFISTSGNLVMAAAGNSSNLPSGTNLSNYTTFKQVLVAGTQNADQVKAWYYQADTTKTTTAKADSSATDSTTAKQAATRILAGAVNLAVYDNVEQNVCVVEVDKAIAPDASYIQAYLNTLYAPAVIKWKVSKASLSTDISGTFDNTIGARMGYNDAEKALCSLVKSQSYYNSNTLYLLYLEKPTTHSEIKGHMPFNELFGFIYGKNQSGLEVPRSMAHELGHGAFRLYHTFSNKNDYVQDSLSTQNLMDYTNGTELLKYQWDECHKWHLGINWFADGDEAASSSSSISCDCSGSKSVCGTMLALLNKIKDAYANSSSFKMSATSPLVSDIKINGTCYKLVIISTGYNGDVSINPRTDLTNSSTFTYTNTYTYNAYGIVYKDWLKIGVYYQANSDATVQESNRKVAEESFNNVKKWLFSGTSSTDKELVSVDLLLQIFGTNDNALFIKTVQPYLNTYMNKFNINTSLRIAHFLAQIGYETGYFSPDKLEEDLYYKACGIRRIFCQSCYKKDKCPTIQTCDCDLVYKTPNFNENRADMCENPQNYARNPSKISMAAYGGYHGRGFIHLSLKSNYVSIYNYLKDHGCSPKDFVSTPKYLSEDYETAAMSACAFFRKKGCNAQADNDNFDGVMNIVNMYDSDEAKTARKALLEKIKGIMNIQ